MFNWFRRPAVDRFESAWRDWLEQGVWQYRYLPAKHRDRLEEVVAHLVARKLWVGGNGFEVTEEMRVVISGVTALMTIGLSEPFFFPQLTSLILYPAGFQNPDSTMGSTDPVFGGSPRLGEAWQWSPIILSWRHASRQARVPGRGRNVTLHEVSHHVDGLDGHMDGIPSFDNRHSRRRWLEVADGEFHKLVGAWQRQQETLLDPYGATNRTEFFAVASECFFERPHRMAQQHGELYELMAEFYKQDSRQWIPKPEADLAKASIAQPRLPAQVPSARRFDLSGMQLEEHDALFTQGVLLLEEKQYEEAQQLFSAVIRASADDGEAYAYRAAARVGLGDYRKAIDDAEFALTHDEEDVEAMLAAAEAHLGMGEEAAAFRMIKRALRLEKDNVRAWCLRGRLEARSRQHAKAIQAFQRVIASNSFDAEAHFRLAACLESNHDTKRADFHRRRALEIDPNLAIGPLAE